MEDNMKPITIILTEGYSDWEIAPLAGVGRAFYGADIRFVSPDGGSVTSIAGLVVSDLERFDAPEEGVVVICGGPAFEQGAPDISARLKKAREAGCVIAGICGGTIALARAGMLDNAKHTSNGPGYLQQHAEGYAGADLYVDQPRALRAGDLITAPAPAPASFAAEVLTAVGLDPQKAQELREMLGKEHAK
jgi:putative intracellular protease/amidase